MFLVNRTGLIVDKLLPCLQNGLIRSKENVFLNNINTLDSTGLGLICNVADGITTLLTMADGIANCGVFC